MKKKILVGITGGVGAGKSAVARAIQHMGYPVLSADDFAREITQAGAPALNEIRALFGDKALLPDAKLNRAYVREEILKSPPLRLKLEAITHPRIQELTQKKSAELFAQGKEIVFYEAPLLFEAKSEKHMDKVICVFADDKTRIERVMKRDSVSKEHAEKILAAQMPQDEKIKRSDFSIENNGVEKDLDAKIQEILGKL